MKNKSQKKNNQNFLPVVLIGIGVLLVLTVFVIQLLQPTQQSATPSGSSSQSQNDTNIPEPGIQRVSLEDSRQAFDEKSAVFLDVRSAESYQAGHIPGAINIPFDQLESRLGELDPNQWIITYCT